MSYEQQRRVIFGPYQCPEHPEKEGYFAVPGHGIMPLNNVYSIAAELGLLGVAQCVTVEVKYRDA